MAKNFDKRSLATIAAALRYWQREGLNSSGHEQEIATDMGEHTRMDSGEIDRLITVVNHRSKYGEMSDVMQAVEHWFDTRRPSNSAYGRLRDHPDVQRAEKAIFDAVLADQPSAPWDLRGGSTVLAALRYWQREGLFSSGHEQDVATNQGEFFALNKEQIDDLCERINIKDDEHAPNHTAVNVQRNT